VAATILREFRRVLMDEDHAENVSLFEAGGDSLMAAELLVALKGTLPGTVLPQLSIKSIFTHPAPASLAAYLESGDVKA
jgi:acyl carrier protein